MIKKNKNKQDSKLEKNDSISNYNFHRTFTMCVTNQ